MNERMRMLVESRHVEEEGADDAEVEGMWNKALRTLRSSLLPGMDQDAAFTLVYQAALQVATAVVRAAGYRVRGDGHHHHTFAAAAGAGSGELSAAARDLNYIRTQRHQAVYAWDGVTSPAELDRLRESTARLLTAAHAWVAAERPHLKLEPPPAAVRE